MSKLLEQITENPDLSRRGFLSLAVLAAAQLTIPSISSAKSSKPEIITDLSRWDKKRPQRPHTEYIVLHTTEASDESSYNSLKGYGTAHYLILTNGQIYKIINEDKIAKHAGRSRWEGRSNIDNWSIGIEVSGFHNRELKGKQYPALKKLVNSLQNKYSIPDEDVLIHHHVAVDTPNKWYSRLHRGRKYDAINIDMAKIGVTRRPTFDPDVKSRKVMPDKCLAGILYKGQCLDLGGPSLQTENNELNQKSFEGFQEIGKDGVNAWRIAGDLYDEANIIYFLNDGRVRTGKQLSKDNLNHLPKGTKLLVGYVYGGHIHDNRPAYQIVGKEWNYPSTIYRFPGGKIVSGDELDDDKIPEKTLVLFRD